MILFIVQSVTPSHGQRYLAGIPDVLLDANYTGAEVDTALPKEHDSLPTFDRPMVVRQGDNHTQTNGNLSIEND